LRAAILVLGLAAVHPDARAGVEIHGTVVDAETGKPIPRFVVQYGRPDPKDPERMIWGWSEHRTESANPEGRLGSQTLGEKGAWLRVLAAGYLPQPITAKPYAGESGTIEVTVRLRRGQQIVGQVLDHRHAAVARASVFLVGGRAAPNITGGMAFQATIGGEEDKTVTRAVTDSEGRFALTGAGAEATTVAVSAPAFDLWLVPAPPVGKELEVFLPEPGRLVLRYDIDGGEPEATLCLQLNRGGRQGWAGADNVREPKVANRGRLVLENVTPGTYDISCLKKNLRVGDRVVTLLCDRRSVVVESGKAAEVAFVHDSGTPVEGAITGLKELNLTGAFVLAKPGDETKQGRPSPFAELGRYVEALTCNAAGRFQTPRLLPGTYTIVAEGYLTLTREQQAFTGWRLADYRAIAVVTVPEGGPAPRVRIAMPRVKGSPP
jgi:hypothetical protein